MLKTEINNKRDSKISRLQCSITTTILHTFASAFHSGSGSNSTLRRYSLIATILNPLLDFTSFFSTVLELAIVDTAQNTTLRLRNSNQSK